MKRGATLFLQFIIVLIGIAAFVLLLWEPHLEWVNANATTIRDIYFDDPFLLLVYAGSIPFFVALFQTFNMLGQIGKNAVFSAANVTSLRIIKYCALAIVGCVATEEFFILINHGNDDAAGAVSLGIMIAFCSIIVATVAAVFQHILQNAVEIKSENDLTV